MTMKGRAKACFRLPLTRFPVSVPSPAARAESISASSDVSHEASRGVSGRLNQTRTPTSMVTMPSIRNIHCHPCSPRAVSNSISAPPIGLPTTRATVGAR
ncbi:hypothetical protein SHIRM173S_08756 [Streptomyces hirsutus]